MEQLGIEDDPKIGEEEFDKVIGRLMDEVRKESKKIVTSGKARNESDGKAGEIKRGTKRKRDEIEAWSKIKWYLILIV
jgi:hypothetical protein